MLKNSQKKFCWGFYYKKSRLSRYLPSHPRNLKNIFATRIPVSDTKKKFRIRIPVWIPKKKIPDSDTGLDTKIFFFGFGYRFGYQHEVGFGYRFGYQKKIPDSDTGLDTIFRSNSGFGIRGRIPVSAHP